MGSLSRANKSVPVFDLYGEEGGSPALDPIHVESIAARSSLHNWEIKPHRHHGLFQVLWLAGGAGRLMLDGALVLLPQHCVHGFRFERDARGMVLTLAYSLLAGMSGELGRRLLSMSSPRTCRMPRSGDRVQIHRLWQALASEYETHAEFRPQLLEALVVALLALLLRQSGMASDAIDGGRLAVPAPASSHLTRFTAEIERSFRTHAPLAHYASLLGLSAAHLNALCREYAGRSALGMIHDRLLLEARRNLVYTAMTVKEVAELLGFSDPAYFTRFFKRATGVSPTDFRGRTNMPSDVR